MDARTPLNIAGGFVAASLVAITAFLTWALVFRAVPTDNREPLLMLIGVLANLMTFVVGYFFGSSQTSRMKDAAIESQANTIRSAQAALAPSEPAIPVSPGESVTVEGKPE